MRGYAERSWAGHTERVVASGQVGAATPWWIQGTGHLALRSGRIAGGVTGAEAEQDEREKERERKRNKFEREREREKEREREREREGER